ncbi:MAG: 3-hydroxyacyl-ACP dehydratase FabZ [Proteobacteria bacterium]|nr:3-hydroxyacyl-ACP dehydratase FabZ [Pseudomonadota bacterium]MBU4470671.1 3-hydroxyacyl-ACP dehydratase FabZ [Pseudomonadota bacterium]MCG2751234.1 3-hydroxyacyl-ACP dehydratase FabZ [Desulfobacteraceae bacterium]
MEYDVRKIMTFLPHRYPFLLVDRILSLTPGESVLALKNVTFNEPFFQGHFPGAPVMPGVLIVEAMGQAGGVLAYESNPEENPSNFLIYLMGLDNVKFRKPVVPGDQLMMELKILKQRGRTVKMLGIAKVDDKVVAEAELLATLGVKE